jgi:hypothetical protein
VIRENCGSVRGALAHQAAGEWPCGWCVHAEQVARLTAERIAPLPVAEGFVPVGDQEAAVNRAVLEREVAAFNRERGHESRRRWLRAVA